MSCNSTSFITALASEVALKAAAAMIAFADGLRKREIARVTARGEEPSIWDVQDFSGPLAHWGNWCQSSWIRIEGRPAAAHQPGRAGTKRIPHCGKMDYG